MAKKQKRKAKARRKPHGARNHKDRLFCDIFSIKEYALSLFNAVNGTNYTDAEGMEIYTIQEVVYITMHNDLAVCFHGFMELFEQQSTKSANMPLREFLYSADEYDMWLIRNKADLLNTKQVKIPAPKCYELYNGLENEPELSEKHLSDAFMHPSPGYEWTVYVININAGKNKKIMDRCLPLKAYAAFVQRVRDNQSGGMKLDDAIQEALDYCIQNNLLGEYFAENRGRVVKMMLTEYASKIHLNTIREEGRAEGEAKGREVGRAEGRAEGREEGRAEGRVEGRESERIFSIRNVMSSLGVGVDRAMEILGIPAGDFPKYRSLL